MKINFSKKFWFYITSITILSGSILVVFPPNEIISIVDYLKKNKSNINIQNNIDDNLLPDLADFYQIDTTTDPIIKRTAEEISLKIPTKKETTPQKPIKKQKPKPIITTIPIKINPIIKKENSNLLALINGGSQIETINIIQIKHTNNSQDKWQNKITDLQEVNTPTIADRIFPREYIIFGILQSKIVSEQSGVTTIKIDRDAYSKSGNNILIPKGSIGLIQYQGGGGNRLTIEIIRITTPNNLTILFKEKPKLADAEGAQGVPGKVDNKYFKKYGIPLIFSFANNTANILSAKAIEQIFGTSKNQNINNAISNFGNDLQNQNNKILQEILNETLKIKPIITLEAGSVVTVRPLKDIYFQEPELGKVYLKIEDTY